MEILYIPYLVGLNETILKPFAKDVDWELEEITGSSNRLTLYVPLTEARDVITDMEILFDSKRYIISEVIRERSSAEAIINADEAQVELSDRNVSTFLLKGATLRQSITRALTGSKWTVGEIFAEAKRYHAEFTNISSIQALQFLANQSGGRLVFDSVNRKVSMAAPEKDEPQVTFRYKSNMEDISKSETQPTATVMYPYGKDGLTVESVNNKLPYIEDFSWYTDLGIDLKTAREKYTKEYVFEDERYIYPANLLTDAKKKLAQLSKPQINYNIKASTVDMARIKLDEQVYVVDEELGIKIKTVVVRMKKCKDATANEIELDYLPASLSVLSKTSLGDSSKTKSETSVFLIKNQNDVTVSTVPTMVLSAEITVFTATYFEAGLKLEIECTQAGLFEGYFMMDGNQVGATIKQSLQVGFYTLGIPFLITQVQEGTKFIDFYMKCTGTVKTLKEKTELFITTSGAYGGVSNTRPDRRVTEDVELFNGEIKATQISDKPFVMFPVTINRKIVENIDLYSQNMNTVSKANVSITMPIARELFANIENYPQFRSPSKEAINLFMDTMYASSKQFRLIQLGDELRVVTHTGKYFLFNLIDGAIVSDGDIVGIGADDELFSAIKVMEWSSIPNVTKVIELEAHNR